MTFSRVADVEQASPTMLADYVRFRATREAEKDQLEKGRVDGKIVGYLLEKSISTALFALVSASGVLFQFFGSSCLRLLTLCGRSGMLL